MYSRYLQTGSFSPEPKQNEHPPREQPAHEPQPPKKSQPPQDIRYQPQSGSPLSFLSRLSVDSSDMLVLMILLLLMREEDNSTMLTALALYFFL